MSYDGEEKREETLISAMQFQMRIGLELFPYRHRSLRRKTVIREESSGQEIPKVETGSFRSRRIGDDSHIQISVKTGSQENGEGGYIDRVLDGLSPDLGLLSLPEGYFKGVIREDYFIF